MKKLAIISTHPIQYYAPVFALLAKSNVFEIKVFYTLGQSNLNSFDKGFQKNIKWDIPLLEGYNFEFLNNTAKVPGSHHFKGIINPNAINNIQNFEPNALLIYGWANQSHLKILRFFKGKIPIWFRGDSTLLNQKFTWKTIFKNLFLKWVYSHVNLAFYVGDANKAYFKKYGLKENQLCFAPHAIDNDRFAANNTKQAIKIRASLGIKPEEILILFAGKLDPIKNPELLLKAFLNLKNSAVNLLFVGNGVLDAKLKNLASKYNAKIHFIDFKNQTEMPAIYQACNLFCLPSTSETWGLGVNEAMASGKAILVSNQVGCAINLVKPGYNGQIFEAENSSDLLSKLEEMCANKTLLNQMGTNSKQIITAWSFKNQVASFIENQIFKSRK